MDSKYLIHNYMFKDHIMINRAKGVRLYGDDGKEYLDCAASPLSNTLGYGNEEMIEALTKQLRELSFAYRVELENPTTNLAAKNVSDWTDGAFDQCFFTSGGSEATEAAMTLVKEYQMAIGQPTKHKIIGRWLSYHGATKGAISISGVPGRRNMNQCYFTEMGHIPPAYCYRCWYGKDPKTCNLECAQALEDEIIMQGPETVGAFIAEPVSGTSLAAASPENPGYFQKIREICDKYGVLLIFDEVMTGFGRTGLPLAKDLFGVTPDIMTFGKAVSGGYYAVGGIACSNRIIKPIKENIKFFTVGYTWCGNPVACAAINKTLEIYHRDNLVQKVREDGVWIKNQLIEMADRHPTMGDVRGSGLMIGIEFVKDKGTQEPFDPSVGFASRFGNACIKNGMILESLTGNIKGIAGDMAMWGPQFITDREDYQTMLEIFEGSLSTVEKEMGY